MKKKYCFFLILNSVFLFADQLAYDSPVVDNTVGLMRSLFKSFVLIVVMLLLFAWWKKKMLPALSVRTSPQQNMRIVEKLFLDYTTMLYLVEVGGQYQVYGVSNKNLTLLNSFKKTEIKFLPENKIDVLPSFKQQLALLTKKINRRNLNKKKKK